MAMPTFPTGPCVPPLAIRVQENGRLDLSKLTLIPGQPSYLAPLVARGFYSLSAASAAAGWQLTYTRGGLYRTISQQETLFFTRYSTPFVAGVNVLHDQRTYDGKVWYLKINPATGQAYAPAAAPSGNAPHCWASAWDVALGTHPDGAKSVTEAWARWAVQNAHLHGFRWSLQKEPWHLQWYYGDVLPPALAVLPPPDPDPTPDPGKEDDVSQFIMVDDGDFAVMVLTGANLVTCPTAAEVDAFRFIKAVSNPEPGQEQKVPRGHLKTYILIGPPPDYTGVPTNIPRTTPAHFKAQVT